MKTVDCIMVCMIGVILVGVTGDEPSSQFSTAALDSLWTVAGVDVRPLVYRGKFVFVAQIGSPQIARSAHNKESNRVVGSRDCGTLEVLRRPFTNCETPHRLMASNKTSSSEASR